MKNKLLNWSTFGILIICIAAILSTSFTIYSNAHLTKQTNSIYKNTYQVKAEVQSIRSRLTEISLTLPAILENDNKGQLDYVENMLKKRDHIQDESINFIREHYLGSSDTIDELVTYFIDLRAERLVAVERFTPKSDLSEITDYFMTQVKPYEDKVIHVLDIIEEGVDTRASSLVEESKTTQTVADVVAIALCVFIILMIIYTTMSENKKNKAIAYREQLFDLLSNNIDDVFYIYDVSNKTYEYVSNNSSHLLGIESKEFLNRALLIRNYIDDESKEAFDEIFNDKPILEINECDLKFSNGNKNVDLKLRIYPIFSNKKLVRYIAVLSDQTKVIEHQNVLHDALLSAQRANAAKRDFLSRMSHEIRTPMNTIIGMTTIGLRHIDDLSYVENCLKKITFSSSHLLSLINDILDMSKIEDNKLSISHELFDFKKLIESITSIVYPQTVDRNQNFELTINGLTQEMLIGDSLRVNQILLNLLSNAVKFTPKDGTIRLDITKLKTKNNQIILRFSVSDTGIGMSEEFLGRLFSPFEQADNSIAQKYGGTGLGMSICKNLVSLMNGTITVNSVLNEGTTIDVEIPFGITEQESIEHNDDLSELKVLVVDDDQNTCEHAMVLMEQIGINASWVCSGNEAIESVLNAHETGDDFDVCFIDWCMPDMDGVETARIIRNKLGPDTLIIIISSYDWSVIENDAREAGVNAFVSKPIFASTICNTLNSIIIPKSAKTTKTRDYNFEGIKILLAEDNSINQEIAEILLNDIGLIVDSVENGKEALEKFENSATNEYALILMDIQMPILNGYDATSAIRKSSHERAKTIPIIAMTANAFNEDVVAAKEAGMNDHISKPIDVDLLYSTIASYIQS